MIDEVSMKRWFRKISEDSGKKIEGSNVFMSIFTTDYKREPQCALELGIAILLDKPIYLVVPNGTVVPKHLEKIAKGIEFYSSDDETKQSFKSATEKLLKGLVKKETEND